jgi:hypothetical protein
MKNRWVELRKGATTCYGQVEDAGPAVYDDADVPDGPWKRVITSQPLVLG